MSNKDIFENLSNIDQAEYSEILNNIFQMIDHGAIDRRSPIHTPIIASIDSDGYPNQRIMVLREFDAKSQILRFHTDARSPKIQEITNNNAMSILAYDPHKRIQLKLYGEGQIIKEGNAVIEAWIQTDVMGRRCYLCEPGSGTMVSQPMSGISNALQSRRPTLEESETGRKNFAVLLIKIHQIDWMHLNSQGNRAASFKKTDGGWNGHWIIP